MEIFEKTAKKASEEQVVIFTIGNEYFGLFINCIDNIIKLTDMTPVPNTKEYIEGLINLRGKIIVVVDLATKMGFSKINTDSNTRIIVIDIQGELMGVRVDSVSETIRIQSEDIRPPPALVKQKLNSEYVIGVTQIGEDDLLTIIDLHKLFMSDLQHEIH